MTSMDNTPDSPAKTPEGYTTQGGNFWTLITPEIWKVLHAVLHPKDAVRVSAENGVLTISGERKLEKEEQGKKFHRIERAYGRFVRSFVLPDNVDPTKVTASMKDGVLEVRLVKAEQAKPKQIEISVN